MSIAIKDDLKIDDSANKRGFFFTIEGGDMSGKTTVIKLVADKLTEMGKTVCRTREPGGTVISEEIRETIIKTRDIDMDPLTEVLLFAASRNEHTKKKIIPNVNIGRIVISDRYLCSSLAYQGCGREVGTEIVLQINNESVAGCVEDKIFILDITDETRQERLLKRGDDLNRLDRESFEFHKRIREGYEWCNKLFNNVVMIDGNRSPELVCNEIISIMINEFNI